MKRCFATALLLSLTAALACAAGEKTTLNTLTDKETADGWLLLFDGETTFGWQAPNGSKWTVTEGLLAPQAGKPGLLVSTTAFADYELHFDYVSRPTPQDGAKRNPRPQVRLYCDREGKASLPANNYELPLNSGGWITTTLRVKAGSIESATAIGAGAATGTASSALPENNGEKPPAAKSGFIALAGNGVVFRNIKLKPLGEKPLFNGKDLTGWKKYSGDEKRAKTEFTVTKEGWLHLKNGPGDLQTTAQYQNFIVQAECFSNGKHLNSGLFFRCLPDQYQNGYEAQIHNGWTDKPEKEYTIEEYDPKTHEPTGKQKVKSAALDYGTGAIYRRIPARKAVAKDGEWFTMTVAAEGRHLATWVNGVQVVDWTDNRPEKDNARNGAKLEKGALSLQGHDPTTDLSFRNLRVVELP